MTKYQVSKATPDLPITAVADTTSLYPALRGTGRRTPLSHSATQPQLLHCTYPLTVLRSFKHGGSPIHPQAQISIDRDLVSLTHPCVPFLVAQRVPGAILGKHTSTLTGMPDGDITRRIRPVACPKPRCGGYTLLSLCSHIRFGCGLPGIPLFSTAR